MPQPKKRTWFSLAKPPKAKTRAKASSKQPITAMVYDDIGAWGVRSIDFINGLRAIDDGESPIVVHMNSAGGDAFEGIALHNGFRALGERCTVHIDSLAASAAGVAALGAHKVVIASNGTLMVHNPWANVVGTADELRSAADGLDTCRQALMVSYRRRGLKIDDDKLDELIDAETWMTAEQALAYGFVDEIGEESKIQARASPHALARYRNAPAELLDDDEEEEEDVDPPQPDDPPTSTPAPGPAPIPTPPPAPEPEPIATAKARIGAACHAAGAADATDAVLLRVAMRDTATVSAEVSRITAIGDLCAIAKRPTEALAHIRAGTAIEAVRTALLAQIVEAAGPDTDSTLPTSKGDPSVDGKPKAKTFSVDAIYKNRAASKQKGRK